MAIATLESLIIKDENDDDFPIIKLSIPKEPTKAPKNKYAYAMNTDEARKLGKALIKLAAELDAAEY